MAQRKSKDQMLAELRNAGYRITPQRSEIITYIAGRLDHPSVQQIFKQFNKKKSGISLATIYNTMTMMVEMKLINEIGFEHEENRYDTNLEPHLNLVCTVCGSIRDYEFKLPVSTNVIKSKAGFITTGYRLEYLGLCNDCRQRTENKTNIKA